MSGRDFGARRLKYSSVPEKSQLEHVEEFIQERLSAPIVLVYEILQQYVDRAWLDLVARDFEIDQEASMCIARDEDWALTRSAYAAFFWFDEDEWHKIALHCDSWYQAASAAFAGYLGPCVLAPLVGGAERMKHFPRAADRTAVDLRRRSAAGNESIFCFGIDAHVLGEFTRSVETDDAVFPLLVGANHLRAFVDCGCHTGFTQGEPTNLLAVEWAASAVHCYPVALTEALRRGGNRPFVYDDMLQGYARDQRAGA